MTDRKTFYNAISNAVWGYFFLSIDIYFGAISILPSFVGYLLLFSTIQMLFKERRDLALLRPLVIFLAVWAALEWLLSWFGLSLGENILFLNLLVIAAILYVHFQFLTDMVALASLYQPEWDKLDQQLLTRRTGYVILNTICVLYAQVFRFDDAGGLLSSILAIALAAAALMVMFSLYRLRRFFDEKKAA